MRKFSKKQITIIIIVAITIIALALIGVLYGIHNVEDKKNLKKDDKIESVEDDKTDEEQEKKDTEKDITSVVEDESEENTSQSKGQTPEVEEPKQETTQQQQQSSTNTNQNQNNHNNSNSGGATTMPSTPSTSHTHSWTEVKGQVAIPETGEYQEIGGIRTWVVETAATTATRVTGYKCSCGQTKTVPDAGMYAMKDRASMDRLDKCANILKGGLVGDARYEYNMVDYFDGHIAISAENTSGAWMYITIGYWDTNGANNTDEMKAVFNEIPVLMKQCFEALAPEGGTDLYNKVNSLIYQYGGPRKVPTQGIIQESVPGLSIEAKKGKYGLELRFFAE